MIEVIKKQWNYILYKNDDNEYTLSVLCGTVGLYDVKVKLNDEQVNDYLEKGEEYLDLFAQKIRSNPLEYIEKGS